MSDRERCGECGARLDPSAPGQVCGRCALSLALNVSSSLRKAQEIGPYRLLRKIGAGGMGEVWLAEQAEPIRRQVALKVIRPGLESETVLLRFEAERQALARMDHPAIARIYDAGIGPDARPYFAMEFVDGEPINRYADRKRLDARQRLELLIQVCDGVQHAHQKALIHRDLKSSNVLVSEEEGVSRPKIIDFGVAKSTGDPFLESAMHTQTGAVVGTPETMSPEQARGSGDIDTRTDVYSLGVILYELLVGELPFDAATLRGAGLAEMLRVIQEDPPPRPSERLGTLEARLDEIASMRGTDPGRLRRSLGGDLDWIAMKALEKDRERRYGSARELAEDLLAALQDRPVQAGPPRLSYRVGKFVRRHRLSVALAGLALAGLLTGLVGTSYGLVRARTAEADARDEALTANRSLLFMVEMFGKSDPGENLGETLTAREVLDQGVERIDDRLHDEPRVRTHLLTKMAEVYQNLGLYAPAEKLIREALETRRTEFGDGDPDTAQSMSQLALLLVQLRRNAEALPILESLLESYSGEGPLQEENAQRMQNVYAMTLRNLGRYDEARSIWEELIRTRTERHGTTDQVAMDASANLGAALTWMGEHQAARETLEDTLERFRQVLGEKHPRTINTLNMLANVQADSGDYEAAEQTYRDALELAREVVGEQHPTALMLIRNLGRLRVDRGDYQGAVAAYRTALDGLSRSLGADHLHTLDVQCVLGDALRDGGNHDEAIKVYDDAMERVEVAHGLGHRRFSFCAGGLVELYLRREDTEGLAGPCPRLVASLREQVAAPNSSAEERNNLAWAMLTCSPDAAPDSPLVLEALELAQRSVAEAGRDPYARATLATALERSGDPAAAAEELRHGLGLVHEAHPFRAELERALEKLDAKGGGAR